LVVNAPAEPSPAPPLIVNKAAAAAIAPMHCARI